MAVQCLCSRLGIATGRDLAQLCRERYSQRSARFQWVLAEISIIATDLAEVLGCALAFHLLLGCSLTFGIALTAFDTLLILALQGKGFRRLVAIMLALVLTIVGCFFVELVLIKPYWPDVFEGFKPSLSAINDAAPLYIAIGIIGATVMPHNLYLHSSIVQTRLTGKDYASKLDAVRLSRIDTIGSLALALLVNAVEAGSPAEKAGIEPGDVITRYEGKAIDKFGDLPRMVGNTKPGTKSAITVFRRGSQRDLSITIAEVEPDEKTAAASAPAEEKTPKASAAAQQLGLAVAELTEAQKKELKVKGGVRVVSAEGAAARAGLREGDVLLAVANTEVSGLKSFEAALAKADKAKPINLLVRRGEWAQYVLIRPTR